MDDWTLLHLEQWLIARVRWLTWTEIRNRAENTNLIVYEGRL